MIRKEPMIELIIGKLPGRKGYYLSERNASEIKALARFLSKETSDVFYELISKKPKQRRKRGS